MYLKHCWNVKCVALWTLHMNLEYNTIDFIFFWRWYAIHILKIQFRYRIKLCTVIHYSCWAFVQSSLTAHFQLKRFCTVYGDVLSVWMSKNLTSPGDSLTVTWCCVLSQMWVTHKPKCRTFSNRRSRHKNILAHTRRALFKNIKLKCFHCHVQF